MSKYNTLHNRILLKQIASALNSNKTHRFESSFTATAEQRRLLTFGAVLFAGNKESCHTLRLMGDRRKSIKMLDEWWGINTRNDALNVARYLSCAEGHTLFADPVYKNLIRRKRLDLMPHESRVAYLLSLDEYALGELGLLGFDLARALAGLEAFNTAEEILVELGNTKAALAQIGTVAAWDYGRTGLIARHSVKAGYLDESEAWGFMRAAADNASRMYRSWREYLAAYAMGRAVGYCNGSADMYPVFRYLLYDENSPYRSVSFY